MNAQQVQSALAARKTVRITYSRTTDQFRVDIVLGDEILDGELGWGPGDEEGFAEEWAAVFARMYDLPITRVDVP